MLDQLIQEANQAAKSRSHIMGNWHPFNGHQAWSRCVRCDMQITVNDKPLPNEIDIGGEAVALECKTE